MFYLTNSCLELGLENCSWGERREGGPSRREMHEHSLRGSREEASRV